MFICRKDKLLVREPGTIDFRSFFIDECENCNIYLLGTTAQVMFLIFHFFCVFDKGMKIGRIRHVFGDFLHSLPLEVAKVVDSCKIIISPVSWGKLSEKENSIKFREKL